MRRRRLTLAMALGLGLHAACNEDGPAPPADLAASDAPPALDSASDGASTDGPPRERGPGLDGPGPAVDRGFGGCHECKPSQICVHFYNSKTCKLFKKQCKDRTPACYSTYVNPCCTCESQVCGLWYTCKVPAGCRAPMDAGPQTLSRCFCFAK